jgi:hypothetical protein
MMREHRIRARMALCALSRGREKFSRCHRLLDDFSVKQWRSSQVRGVIDLEMGDLEFVAQTTGKGRPSFDQ